MRLREILLFLVYLSLAMLHREEVGSVVVQTVTAASSATAPIHGELWRYDERAEYFEVMPRRIQAMTSKDPQDVARAVCGELGGNVDFIQSPQTPPTRIGFNCAFHEPDISMSVDFGDLRRTTKHSP